MESLFPTFDVPSAIVSDKQREEQYAPAPLWNYEAGEFITDGANKSIYGSGYDAWVLWCIKSIMTQRWAHLGYSSNEGIEAEQAFKQPDREAVQSAFERTITEALLADPMHRTTQVKDFKFSWQTDSLWIECVAIGTDGQTADLKAKIPTI